MPSNESSISAIPNPQLPTQPRGELTAILQSLRSQSIHEVGSRFFALANPILYGIARRSLRRSSGRIEPEDLVQACWIKLLGALRSYAWKNSGHFKATVAKAMRHLIIDDFRWSHRKERLQDSFRVKLEPDSIATSVDLVERIAFEQFCNLHPRPAAALLLDAEGYTNEEIAKKLGCSRATVCRDLFTGKVLLTDMRNRR